jgi:hypothetical protein
MSIMTATPWAMAARTDPNFLQHMLRRGPIQQAMPNIAARTPALTAIGAKATMATRINELVASGVFPSLLSAITPTCALMNRYGISVTATIRSGPTISPKKRFVKEARGTSPESFWDGSPRAFRLYPVILVRERRQKAIHEEEWDLELPLESHLRKSR